MTHNMISIDKLSEWLMYNASADINGQRWCGNKERWKKTLEGLATEWNSNNNYVECQTIDSVSVVRCRDCENWIPGTITDHDDFIPPRCGKYHQFVGHSNDDYCSLAEKKIT